MLLCQYCINELASRGECFTVSGRPVVDYEESEETNTPCEWCGECDDLYEVETKAVV